MKRRVTSNKKRILDAFEKQHLLDGKTLGTLLPDIDPATIYRNLKRFEEDGIIKQVPITSETVLYELACKNHHHHIMCISCKKVIAFSPDEAAHEMIESVAESLEKKFSITIRDHSFEFYGICSHCNTH